jgi:hypothetical protein
MVLLLAACGGEAASDDASLAAGPGILDLLDRSEGRVELQPGGGDTNLAPRGTADFFDGGHRLRFDEHPDLAGALDAYRSSLADRNRGVESWAQVTLPDADPLLHRATLVDLVAGIYLSEGALFAVDDSTCRRALEEERERFVTREPPPPRWERQPDGTDHWDYPIESVPRFPPCISQVYGDDELDPGNTALRLRRDLASGSLEVLFDPGHYADPRFDPLLLLVVTSEAPDSERPPVPHSTIFEPTTVFLLAVNQCGELPWAYSNFMAGNSYTSPADSTYLEPGVFTTGYVCAGEVPEQH